jgi:hypothetical protein
MHPRVARTVTQRDGIALPADEQGITYRYESADADSVVSPCQVSTSFANKTKQDRPSDLSQLESCTQPIARVSDEDWHRCHRDLDTLVAASAGACALSPGQASWFDLDHGCPIPLAHGALLRFTRSGLASERRERPISDGKDVSRYVALQRRRILPGRRRPDTYSI